MAPKEILEDLIDESAMREAIQVANKADEELGDHVGETSLCADILGLVFASSWGSMGSAEALATWESRLREFNARWGAFAD